MEDNKEFQTLNGIKAGLGVQLEELEEISQDLHQQRRSIDETFERLMHAMEARKQFLLAEMEEILLEKEIQVDTTRTSLKNAIRTCNELLSVGSAAFKLNAHSGELIWKQGTQSMEIPSFKKHQLQVQLEVNMPPKLLEDINTFGTVAISNNPQQLETLPTQQYNQIDKVTTLASMDFGIFRVFNGPTQLNGCCYDPFEDCLYACYGSEIKKVTMKGKVTTFVEKQDVGNCIFGSFAMHYASKMCFATCNNKIMRVPEKAPPVTIVKNANNALFYGITVDQATGNGFATNINHNTIHKLTATGISILAGSGNKGYLDGVGNTACFNTPVGLCVDGNSVLVCDQGNNAIRRVSMKGQVATVCKVDKPSFIAVTPSRNILISSSECKQIFLGVKQSSGMYEIRKLVGTGAEGSANDGTVEEASFTVPRGIVLHEASRTVFVCDGNRIRKISFV